MERNLEILSEWPRGCVEHKQNVAKIAPDLTEDMYKNRDASVIMLSGSRFAHRHQMYVRLSCDRMLHSDVCKTHVYKVGRLLGEQVLTTDGPTASEC